MYPLLANIGPIPIHTYGFFIAFGFLAALYVAKTLAQKSGINPERVLDLAFWCLITGFIGARIVFIITRLSYFMAEPMDIFKVWEGGLVFYGGPLVAVPCAIWYMRKHKMPAWKTADCCLPGLTIAHMFGRFGCLSAGCCYGRPTGSSWGVKLYSDLVDPQLRGVPLHPTQLYEAGALFCLLLGLLWVFKRKSFDGQVALTYFMAYPIIRSVVEMFRGDLIRGFVIDGVLSTSQFISILVFIAASFVLFYRLRQVHHKERLVTGGGGAL